MTFTIEAWKEKAQATYQNYKQWVKRPLINTGFTAYGALSGMTLWPLIEYALAAAQAGQPFPLAIAIALGNVASGVGSNLLASQIHDWFLATANGHKPTEADVLAWLQTEAVREADLQTAIDQILEKLEAVSTAQAVIEPSDWTPFAQQLREDLNRLGSLPRFSATLTGSGTIVQGDGNKVAINGGVIVERDFTGDINTGTINKLIVDPEKMDESALRHAYLSKIVAERNRLWLGGIDPQATKNEARLQLSAVYTALLTERTEGRAFDEGGFDKAKKEARLIQKEPRHLSALEQLNQYPHLVLLGDPGSGKSTFVNFVTACMAGELLGDSQLGLSLLRTPLPVEKQDSKDDAEPIPQPWDRGALLPVPIVLRDLAARGLPKAGQKATANHLWHFIEGELTAASLGEYARYLKKELMEQGGLFLFDGLDEVPTAEEHRLHIRQLVEDVATTFPKCRLLVTSRTYAYQEQNWRLPEFEDAVLAPFSKGQISRFVSGWYEHISQVRYGDLQDAQGRSALLQQAIFNNPRLYELAERPLLLTLMASLHAWRGGSLPEKRQQLYEDSVVLLLDVWEEQRIVRDENGNVRVIQPSLEQWLKIDRTKVRKLLNKLAYEAHGNQRELVGTADIAEETLVMSLLKLSEDKGLQPKRLVEFLSERAGLLLPRGIGVYTFPHRTFQEYLAACHLTDIGYPEEPAQLARQDPNRWREVTLLAGAKAADGATYALWALVQELCQEEIGEGGNGAYWGAHLAAQAVLENADLSQLSSTQEKQVDKLRHWLVNVVTKPTLPAIERALAGRHLARLGDPRPEVIDVDEMQFCYVPAGSFWMGEGDEAHLASFLSEAYWLARFPVTHAHYMAFVQEDGYANAEWWPEAIEAGTWKEGMYTGWGNARNTVRNYGDTFQLSNLPVVGVSWYEAIAYCHWLTARWHGKGFLSQRWQVTLPSEAEWEKGARGGLDIPSQPLVRPIEKVESSIELALMENPAPKRPFTWAEGEISAELANYNESEINQTSTVGVFQNSTSVHGCEELLGNVFEWTRSLDKMYPYDPNDGREKLLRKEFDWTIRRGGSWVSNAQYGRCGARLGGNPGYDYDGGGFRVMLSPLFDSGL